MSTNKSKQHREDLLDKIRQIRTYIAAAPQDSNTGNLLQYLDELTKDVKGKKYGLVFEQHREEIDEKLETHTPVLSEQKELFIDNGGEMNFLIEGDNLAALKLLEKTHKGKIDVIYIDPPYNTGNEDFMYDDDFVGNDDMFRHSKWVSFIEKRLSIAKKLLNKNGLIFISIDDNEQASLKLTCDSIFGENNFIAMLVIETGEAYGAKVAHKEKTIFKVKDYVYVYQKDGNIDIKRTPLYDASKNIFDSHYTMYVENGQKQNLIDRLKGDTSISELFEKEKLKICSDNIPILMSKNEEFKNFIYSNADKICKDQELSIKLPEDIESMFKDKPIVEYKNYQIIKTSGGKYRHLRFFKDTLHHTDDYSPIYAPAIVRGDLWKNFVKDMGNVAKEGDCEFKNGKKPVRLIKQLIKWANSKNGIILDFFAGSGTTGHALMNLNTEDGGHRKFILCTNNENNICRDVTYERLRTVITGKRKDGSEYNEKHKASLKYFKIDFVPINDKLYYEYADQLLLHIRELVELENGIYFNGNDEIAIVLTDEEMEQFVAQEDNKAKVLYRGHDVLLTGEQEEYLRTNGIKVNVIPDYYYNELNK